MQDEAEHIRVQDEAEHICVQDEAEHIRVQDETQPGIELKEEESDGNITIEANESKA